MDYLDYSVYLRRRSPLGEIYRKYWLYPRLSGVLLGRALDVGCGIGDMLAFRPDTIGVDVNPHNVAYCNARGLDAVLMSPDQLPLDDNSVDSVLLDNVLEHIADPVALLAEILRVVRQSGVVLIGVPGVRGQASDSDHKVFYDETGLAALAQRSGFRAVHSFHMPLWRSEFLSRRLRQYCIYVVWRPLPAQVSGIRAGA